MKTIVHYQTTDVTQKWNLHAWTSTGKEAWDLAGTLNGDFVDFQLPEGIDDLRRLKFKFRSTKPDKDDWEWEPDDFVQHIRLANPSEIWAFPSTGRLMYDRDPFPSGGAFNAGDVLTFHVITLEQFQNGQIFVWDPYSKTYPPTQIRVPKVP